MGDDTELEFQDEVIVTNNPFETGGHLVVDCDDPWNPAMLYAKMLLEGTAGETARALYPDKNFRVILIVENMDDREDRGGGFAGVANPQDAIESLLMGAQDIAHRFGHKLEIKRDEAVK